MQSLGIAVQLLKMVLFAQLASSVGGGEGKDALKEVVPLLALTTAYWLYVRIFVPLNKLADVLSEVRWFDIGSKRQKAGELAAGMLAAFMVLGW